VEHNFFRGKLSDDANEMTALKTCTHLLFYFSFMLVTMLGALRELPVSVLLTSFAIAVAALPVQTAALQPPLIADNFKTAIAKGVWFVEHYSPYCGHCKAFAPTWEKLAEESENYPGVELAQVDCSVSGGA
jgi:thiol-disulfide isomerase/thioredoxin